MNIFKTAKSYARTSLNLSAYSCRRMTNKLRVLPDFLIIGGQRCGTSSLYYYLTEIPGIVSAFTKEPHFFDECFGKGPDWYRAQFPSSMRKMYIKNVRKGYFLTGEGTPYYIMYPHTPKRVLETIPHVKLIALLRNPVDRAYSQYWIEVKAGFETWSFQDAVKREQERLAGEFEKMLEDESYYSHSFRHFSYLRRGIYVDQLQNWTRYFPREQLLILRSEDLYKDPATVLKRTLEFLDVPAQDLNKEYKNYRRPSKTGYRKKEAPPKMDPEIRKYLLEYFKPHNTRLYDYLGIDFRWDS
jgi:hypothetical protein